MISNVQIHSFVPFLHNFIALTTTELCMRIGDMFT